MTGLLIIGIIFFLLAAVVMFPIIFRKWVRRIDLNSSVLRILKKQYVYPDENMDEDDIAAYYSSKISRIDVDINNIGKNIHAIRQLTGSGKNNHIIAIKEIGKLINQIGEIDELGNDERREGEEKEKRICSIEKIINCIINYAENTRKKRNGDVIQTWLEENVVPYEQIIEVAIASIVLLHSRLKKVD